MPYRHAHWWLLALFPLIAVAYWPGYLGQFRKAPFALHAHGMSAATWLALLTAQSWSIHSRRIDVHRLAGRATFAVLPLFAVGGPLALIAMARLFATRADPFHIANGAGLVIADLIAGPSVIALVVYAFMHRREMRAHAAAMLATSLLALPPILGRLCPLVPGFPGGGALGMSGFELSFQLAEGIALVIALALTGTGAAARLPFGFAALASLAQMIGFAILNQNVIWDRFVFWLATLPPAPIALAGGAAALGLLIWAWRRLPPRRAAATGFAPVTA